jgi:hypothetical protein
LMCDEENPLPPGALRERAWSLDVTRACLEHLGARRGVPSPSGRGQGEGSNVTFSLAALGLEATNSSCLRFSPSASIPSLHFPPQDLDHFCEVCRDAVGVVNDVIVAEPNDLDPKAVLPATAITPMVREGEWCCAVLPLHQCGMILLSNLNGSSGKMLRSTVDLLTPSQESTRLNRPTQTVPQTVSSPTAPLASRASASLRRGRGP